MRLRNFLLLLRQIPSNLDGNDFTSGEMLSMPNILPAARVGDPIGHTPLLGMILKVGAGILTGLAVGFAIGVAAAATAAFIGFTGGLGAAVAAAVIGSVFSIIADETTNAVTGSDKGLIGFITDKAAEGIDSVMPKDITGQIVSGSANVHINNRNAAVTLISKVACSKHSPSPEAAEGASHVHINMELCHRQKDKVCCGGETLEGSPNVHVGCDPQAQCEIQDEMPVVLQYISKYAGMAIALCMSRGGSLGQKLLCFGVNFAISAGADLLVRGAWNFVKSSFGGKPVLAVTGSKFLSGEDDTDFSVPSRLPIVWQRRYNSLDTRQDGPFGQGWTTPYSVQLKMHQEGEHATIYVDESGREIFFPALQPGESAWNTNASCRLAYTPGGQLLLEGADGLFRDFGKPFAAGPHTLNLERLEDRNANWVNLYYSDEGVLQRMADSAGHLLRFTPHATHQRRISMVEVCSPRQDDAAWRTLVEYAYDAGGRLASVTDALGNTVRRFTCHDTGAGSGLMASHTLASGLSCHYEWAMFDHPRVVRTAHSDGRSWDARYDIENGITRTVDFLGRKEEWTWDAECNLLSHTDAMGQTTRLEWNENNQPVAFIKPNGAKWVYEYDEQSLPVKIIDPLGGVSSTTWNHLVMQPATESDPAGNGVAYTYDELGNLIAYTDPMGQVTEYGLDSYGQVCAVTDPHGGIIRLVWGDDGQIQRRIDCSGNETEYAYDTRGNPVSVTDAEGNITSYRHDLLGRATDVMLADGSGRSVSLDAAGRPVAFTDGLGHVSRYEYTPRDQIMIFADALGGQRRYQYNRAGNLVYLRNENDEDYAFTHDLLDRQITQTGLDGSRTEWVFNSLGLPVEVREAAGTDRELRTILERDILGRLTRKTTSETCTTYRYSPIGQLVHAERTDNAGLFIDSLALSYDGYGNIIEEKTVTLNADGTEIPQSILYDYNELGNRTRVTLPDGQSYTYSLCGSGVVHQISVSEKPDGLEQIVSAMERDGLKRETLRTQGNMHLHMSYDPLSRITRRSSRWRKDLDLPEQITTVEKAYGYDRNGELVEKRDNYSGTRKYAYDALGRITSSVGHAPEHRQQMREQVRFGHQQAVSALFDKEVFAYDAASNLLATGTDAVSLLAEGPSRPSSLGRGRERSRGVAHNRLNRLGKLVFIYDEYGRTIEKRDEDARTTWHYAYNCEHQLTEAKVFSRSGFRRVSMEYDLLGRRIRKSGRDRETSFLWSGMRLARESSGTHSASYVYEQDSYVPLARVDTDDGKEMRMYYFHCAANGMPEDVTDREGRLVWRARYSIPGKTLFEQTSKHAPAGFEQNLRMQGQYDDRETGLYYNTFRYYDADSGRFTTHDPIGLRGGMNLYQYAPNPMSWIDPWGWEGEESGGITHIFRAMTESNGKPAATETARGLGARPQDIPSPGGQVSPNTGGVSAAPSPQGLPDHRRPPEYGGTGKDPVWKLDLKDIDPDLKYVPDSPTHGTIQPARPMSLETYQNKLKAMADKWTKCLSK